MSVILIRWDLASARRAERNDYETVVTCGSAFVVVFGENDKARDGIINVQSSPHNFNKWLLNLE